MATDAGMTLPEVQEGEASPEVRAIFREITATLRVPFVGLMWRVLASDPAVLQAAWGAVAPNLKTWAAERAADRLRGRALIVEAASISSHKAFKGDLSRAEIDFDLRSKIGNFNHIALYALPKHLLASAMLLRALEGGSPAPDATADAGEIPTGMAEGVFPVSPVDPATARGRAAELLPVVAQGHAHATAEDYFRSLARLPDYLAAAWNALIPIVRDPEYDARGAELARMADEAAAHLPHPVTLDPAAMRSGTLGDVAGVLRLFHDRVLPDVLIDAALVTALTDGPDEGGRIPYTL